MEQHYYLIILVLFVCYVFSSTESSFANDGCYMDFDANITYTNTTVMSMTVCTDFCNEHDYIWAALSTSTLFMTDVKCSCGNDPPSIQLNNSYCSKQCPSNKEEICGGSNSSMFYVFKKINTGHRVTGNNHSTIIAVVVSIAVVAIVFVVVVIMLVLHRRRSKCRFDPVSTSDSNKSPDKKLSNKTSNVESPGLKAKPNQYVHTEHKTCNTEDKEIYENAAVVSETTSKKKEGDTSNQGENTESFYLNQEGEKYENNQEVVTNENGNCSPDENQRDEFYQNVDDSEFLNYEIPVVQKSAKHLYLKLSEDDKEQETAQNLVEEEYEMMMSPVKATVNKDQKGMKVKK